MRTGRFSSGPRLVAEAAYRRLRTKKGTLRGGDDELDYGMDLLDAIGRIATASEAAALPGQIEAELSKDERIEQVDVDVTAATVGPSTTWTVKIDGHTAAGPFSLVLNITDVTVEIIGVTPGV